MAGRTLCDCGCTVTEPIVTAFGATGGLPAYT